MIISEYERLLQNSVFFCIYISKIKDLTLALLPGKLRASSGPKLQHVITDQRTRMHPMLCHETVRLNETAVFFSKDAKWAELPDGNINQITRETVTLEY